VGTLASVTGEPSRRGCDERADESATGELVMHRKVSVGVRAGALPTPNRRNTYVSEEASEIPSTHAHTLCWQLGFSALLVVVCLTTDNERT
jgi:hypothetical protein